MDTLKSLQAAVHHREHTRRAAVAGMSGMALSGVLAPALAGKKTRKAVKRAKKNRDKKCRNQEGQCVQSITELCNSGIADPADAAVCIAEFGACCAFLGDCQMTSFFDCTLAL